MRTFSVYHIVHNIAVVLRIYYCHYCIFKRQLTTETESYSNIGGCAAAGTQHSEIGFFFRFPFFFSYRPKVNVELLNPFPFQKRIIRHVEQKPGGKKRTSSRSNISVYNIRLCI